jgi:hypothetical protein
MLQRGKKLPCGLVLHYPRWKSRPQPTAYAIAEPGGPKGLPAAPRPPDSREDSRGATAPVGTVGQSDARPSYVVPQCVRTVRTHPEIPDKIRMRDQACDGLSTIGGVQFSPTGRGYNIAAIPDIIYETEHLA